MSVRTTPLLSYIIPAYNARDTLRQCVRSVLAQTESATEAIIVDDGSTDETSHIAASLAGPRVRCLTQPNEGLSSARNTGWSATNAPYICFLDSDDCVAPTHAQKMIDRLQREQADAAACSHQLVGSHLEPLDWVVPVLPTDTTPARLYQLNPLAIGAVVFQNHRLRRLLDIPSTSPGFDPSLPSCEDWDLYLQLAGAGVRWAEPVDDALFFYRITADSMCNDCGCMWQAGLRVLNRHRHLVDQPQPVIRQWHLRSFAHAIARSQADLITTIAEVLGPLTRNDLPTLAGALRWAFGRSQSVGPSQWSKHMAQWSAVIRTALADEPLCDALLCAFDAGPHRWHQVMRRAAAMLEPGQPLVIYGCGRNSHLAREAARQLDIPCLLCDDDPAVLGQLEAKCHGSTLAPQHITPDHVVLITPEHRHAIIDTLTDKGITRLLVPDAA